MDQILNSEASDLSLHCLHRSVCPNTEVITVVLCDSVDETFGHLIQEKKKKKIFLNIC